MNPSKKAIAYVVAGSLATSLGGTKLIQHYEGLRLSAYKDAIGVSTICYGYTNNVKIGQKATVEQCQDFLVKELSCREKQVAKVITVPISQQQFDAMISLQYNVGQTNFKNSTLLKKLNKGDYCGAAKQFPRWNRAGGKVLKGLTERRIAEQELFLAGTKEECNVK